MKYEVQATGQSVALLNIVEIWWPLLQSKGSFWSRLCCRKYSVHRGKCIEVGGNWTGLGRLFSVHTHLWFPGLWNVAGAPGSWILHRVWLTAPSDLGNTHIKKTNFSLVSTTPPRTRPCVTIFSISTSFSTSSLLFRQTWLSSSCSCQRQDTYLKLEKKKQSEQCRATVQTSDSSVICGFPRRWEKFLFLHLLPDSFQTKM